MYADWGTGLDMYEEDADDIALMAIEESEPEPESDFEGMKGNRRRKMARKETKEFYINAVGSVSSISSSVGGKSFTLTAEVLEKILGVPNLGWCHYVKRSWPPLEGLPPALEISRRFTNDPLLEATLTAKNEKIIELQASHSVAIDQLHIDYGIQHAGLVEENSRLKKELAQIHAVLNAERSSNSVRLKHSFGLLYKCSSPSSSDLPPSI
ncbi:hypothetical protein H5410_060098 [Solanum commersonii]|uniref:Uncharacterized protein n=1 Tax=Solanum commersonii TaxID=4109 RepID=A0A9J5W4Z2_SOLCO|nr:hypothetical protein H5410_060098 [Solanum commersonii]